MEVITYQLNPLAPRVPALPDENHDCYDHDEAHNASGDESANEGCIRLGFGLSAAWKIGP